MSLTSGTQLGTFEILSLLGKGGMGEVYRARDSRLKRDVAIKILPDEFSRDHDRLNRFQREAEVLASLNHPNIAQIFGLEESGDKCCIVMELVKGETLQSRLKRGPIPVDETLGIAKQICEALEAAHDKGVIHRDLKPGNVMLTADGKVKILDFGLAKAIQEQQEADLSNSPTMMSCGSMPGVILGTAAYMSPEQAKGRTVDKRTDIFAFGCVLYEMLTCKRTFDGDDVSEILARVIEREPDWNLLPPGVPPRIRELLRLCLEKNARKRLRDSGDVLIQIEEGVKEPPASNSIPVAAASRSRLWIALGTAAALTIIALAAALFVTVRSPHETEMVRFTVAPPEKTGFENGVHVAPGATAGSVSPDGRRLAFTARDASGTVLLWLRPLDALAAQPLTGTEGAGWPFWSPDGHWIAFFAQGKLKKVDVSGGPPQVLCDAPNGRGGTWNQQGVIVFAPVPTGPLSRVSAAGSEASVITKLLPQQSGHRLPAFLPDGKHFIYWVQGNTAETSGVFLANLDSTESHLLLRADSAALYSPPGALVFIRQGTLLAQPFDANKLQLTGDPVRLTEQVPFSGNSRGFAVSDNGVLVYRTGPTNAANRQLAWYDRTGKLLESVGAPGLYRGLNLAPDGKRIAIDREEATGSDIWLFPSAQMPMTRLTFAAPQNNSDPVWSPDGKRLAFASLRNGKWGIYLKSADNTGNEELLAESNVAMAPMSWSPDGKFIVYGTVAPRTTSTNVIGVLPLADRKSFPILQSQSVERWPQISPNGKWIAYSSIETGREEVYIQPFPEGAGKWQISSAGGVEARWRGDSKGLFYLALTGKVEAVDIRLQGSSIERGAPRELFDSGSSAMPSPLYYFPYTVSPDGQRFLIERLDPSVASGETETSALTVVLNWTALLKK